MKRLPPLLGQQCIALLLAICALAVAGPSRSEAPDLDLFIRNDVFRNISLSPTGEFLAATVPLENKTGLVILRTSDRQKVAAIGMGQNTHVRDFYWVNDSRVLFNIEQRAGLLAEPLLTGELFGIDADGARSELLIGWRAQGPVGSHIRGKATEAVYAELIDDLPEDDKHVLVATTAFNDEAYTRAEKMDVYSGRRHLVATVPVRRADFVTDNQGQIRLAVGADSDNASKLFYRDGPDADWQLINNESESGLRILPLGFMPDGKTVLMQSEMPQGTDVLLTYDPSTGKRGQLIRDEAVDPLGLIYDGYGNPSPVGAFFLDAPPRALFFDDESDIARQYRSLQAAFPGHFVRITSKSKDKKLALVEVSSSTNPGDFFLFDLTNKKAEHLLSRRSWFDPEQMHEMKPVQFTARDGLKLHGFLTTPRGSEGKSLPLIVHPHGGPIGIFDTWGFNDEVQLLASAGYAVLQVNFRGSGNYGREFLQLAAQQWGGTMQDDLTDATRWAIEQGIADPQRICLFGASYGAYASLMGVAKEPDLYRCAVGYVGVYDLKQMAKDDSRDSRSAATFMREWVGEGDALEQRSATTHASKVKVPVFLIAGGEDEIAPQKHSKAMEAKLRAAKVPVETLYVRREGHGFYMPENRKEFYDRLLRFLAKHLANDPSSPPAAAP